MPLVSRIRPRIGDIIEIPTPSGLAYAHYTHQNNEPPHFGSLLRILPGLFPSRPNNFSAIAAQEPVFSVFFPLGAACSRKIVSVVASEPIALPSASFPTFRNSHSRSGPWFLWDGQKEWQVSSLTPRQLKAYPPLGIVNDTLLVQYIVQGWRHEHHPVAA